MNSNQHRSVKTKPIQQNKIIDDGKLEFAQDLILIDIEDGDKGQNVRRTDQMPLFQ